MIVFIKSNIKYLLVHTQPYKIFKCSLLTLRKIMKQVSMQTASPINSISNRINKINLPQNKILTRLQAQLNYGYIKDPREAYSRMHNRHNRS